MALCILIREVLRVQVLSTYSVDIPASEVVGDGFGDRWLFCYAEDLLNHFSSFAFCTVKSISKVQFLLRLLREVNNTMDKRDLGVWRMIY